ARDRNLLPGLAHADGIDRHVGLPSTLDYVTELELAVQIHPVGQNHRRFSSLRLDEHADSLGSGVEIGRTAARTDLADQCTQTISIRVGRLADAEFMVKKNQTGWSAKVKAIEKEPGGLPGFVHLAMLCHAAACINRQDRSQGISRGRSMNLQFTDT